MPKLDLTITADVLSEDQKPELMRELGATLLQWEGAPDTEFFRSITWAHLHELPAEAIQTPDGVADPHAILDITDSLRRAQRPAQGGHRRGRLRSSSSMPPAGGPKPEFVSGC